MGDQMERTLVNPNQLRACGVTVQDNPFSEAPIFIGTEGDEFALPLKSKGTVLGVATGTPTDQELQTCLPHVQLSSEHEWDPQNVRFPEASRTVEEEISRTVGAVTTQGGSTEFDESYDDYPEQSRILNVGNIYPRLVASINIRQVSQVEVAMQDVPQAKSFQSKG